jgi:hypothetical protein
MSSVHRLAALACASTHPSTPAALCSTARSSNFFSPNLLLLLSLTVRHAAVCCCCVCAQLCAGAIRSKNTMNILLQTILDAAVSAICWYLVG